MATSNSGEGNPIGDETLANLDEVVEGDHIISRNYRFAPVGANVPIRVDFRYDSEAPPSQPLAVSQQFHLLFVAHSDGFYVVRTEEAMKAAEKIKEGIGPTIEEICMLNIPLGKVSILTLSSGDSTLAASVENELHFFSIGALLHKDKLKSYSVSVDESDCVKDVKWTRKAEKSYLVLSNNGKLYHGSGRGAVKSLMVNVDAVEWSAEGDLVAVARKNILSILSLELVEKFSFSLLPKSLIVDSIRWPRPNSIILGGSPTDDESEDYLVLVINGHDKEIIDDSCKPIVVSFNDMFLDFQTEVIPGASGPNLFLSYLDHQDVAFIANRKNLAQHVVLLGWSLEDKKNRASIIEISNDAWCAHIESQENDEDNSVLGLSIDKVSQNNELKFLLGEEEKEVSPCSVLICLTIDGKLALFHFASAIGSSVSSADLTDSVGEENDSQEFVSEQNVSVVCSSDDREEIGEKVDLSFPANDTSKSEIKGSGEVRTGISESSTSFQYNRPTAESISFTQEEPVLHIQPVKDDEERKLPTMKLSQDRSILLSVSPEKSGSESEQSLSSTSQLVGPGIVSQNANVAKTHESAEALPHVDSFSGKQLADLSSQTMTKNLQTFGIVQYPDKAAPSNSETAPSFSWSSGKTAPSKNTNERSSSSSTTTTGNVDRKSSGSFLQFSGNQFRYPSQVKEAAGISVPINSSGQKDPIFAGNVYGGPQMLSQPSIASGKSLKSQSSEESSTISVRTGLASSERNLPKQFRNVEDMAKQMDRLLEGIERTGGFKDAAVTYLKNSVETLEEGLWNLSESCTMWRGVMDERLKEIQLLLDKTVEVLARKIYIRGVLKQATDTQYWDLWNCQKLSSELEMKRQHILEVNQGLTIQLLELEKHLNTIELNKFGERGGFQENQRAARIRHGNTRQFQSLHSLHNTMGAQLAAAEKLSECLSKQMSALSVESPAKKQNVKKELFETIGLTYDAAAHYSSPGKDNSFTSPARNRQSISSFSAAVKEESKKCQVTHMKISEPETVRRRRESLDQSLSRYEPPKTTVKRILLQEESKKASTSKSLFRMDEQYLNVQKKESTVIHSPLTDKSGRPTYGLKNQVIPRTQTKQSVEGPSTSLFQWADSTENFHASLQQSASTKTAALSSMKDAHMLSDEKSRSNLSLNKTSNSSSLGDSRSMGQSEVQYHDSLTMANVNPLEMMQSNKNWMAIRDFSGKEFGSSEPRRSEMHTAPDSGGSKTSFPASAFGSNSSFSGNISQVKISAAESHPIQTVSSTSVQSSTSLSTSIDISTTSSSTKLNDPASSFLSPSSKWDTSPQANADANQKTSQPKALASSSFTFPSTLSFPTSEDGIISSTSANAMNEISTSPDSACQSNVSLFGTKRNENPMTQNTISNSSLTVGENLRMLASVSQPELPSAASDLKPGQTMPLASTAGMVASLKSENQINVGRISSPVLDFTSNDKSEQSSAFQFNSMAAIQGSEMSNDGKMGSLDVVSREDEMEEEAPETDLGTELSLGNLGGFGIGSTPVSSTVKPNPFGLGVPNNAATPVISPFTPPAHTGELFRPASFNFQPQPSQPANVGAFPSGFGTSSTNQVPTGAGFGQPAQFGPGQKVLGSVLGSFGQSRQIGTSLPASGIASPSGFASGFSGASSSAFGGFAASSGGGFSSLASSGPVGFAGAATGAGGFAGAASASGGFAAAATGGSGFAGAGFTGTGFGAFSNQQSGGGFSAFGNNSASGRPPSELFTQMRR